MESRVKSCTNCERREADLDFCGVHVYIDLVVGHFEEEQRGGKNVARQNVAVGFVDGVEKQAIANQAAIHEDVNAVAVGALDFRTRSETVDGEARLFLALF